MAELSDWQWGIGAALLILALVIGGWIQQRRDFNGDQGEQNEASPKTDNTPVSELEQLRQQLEARDSELSQLRQQLEARDSELSQLRQQLEARDSELSQLRQQLEAREGELKDAREEAELTLLQLHQVQEELEHYFLESRDLQQKLDATKTEAPTEEKTSTITPEQQDQLKRINARLLELFKTLPASVHHKAQFPSGDRLEALVRRQQNALRRFQALQKTS